MQLDEILKTNDLYDRYGLVYDYICDFIDRDRNEKNYCDFRDGKCIANRLHRSVHNVNGCCYIRKVGLCSHLVDGSCTIKNITCKIFVCEYLESKGIKYDLKDILPVKKIFNRKQINLLRSSYFKPKEEIINMLVALKKK